MTVFHRIHRDAQLSTADARDALADPRIEGFASANAELHYAPELRLQPDHLTIHVVVSPADARAELTVTHRIRANGPGARRIVLDGIGFEGLALEAEGLGGWSYDGEQIDIAWENAFESNETREVTLRYVVREPAAGLYFTRPSETDRELPLMAYTDHETERARHWLATVDQPAVRTTVEIAIRAPKELSAIATGAEQGREEHDDGSATTRFALEQRCPSYLLTWSVADFVRWDGGEVDGVSLAAFVPAVRGDREFLGAVLERSFGRIGDMIAWLPEQVGVPFPYPKYHQYAAPFIGGAMENISLTSWDDRYLLDESLEKELRQLFDIINLHELAHTWFGDHVVCRDYAHAWLKESWATYMESCWLDHDQGPDAGAHWRWLDKTRYFQEANQRYKRPIVLRRFDASFDMYDMHLYPGGARRVHMLRKLLGEETFWSAVREYVQTFGDDTVETDDFRRILERKSGRSLARFFDQWLHSPGHPVLEGRFRWDAEKKEGSFELKQKQVDAKKGIPCFDLAPALAWRIGDTWHREVVAFEGTVLQARFAMDSEPDEVLVDPDDDLLFELSFEVGDKRLENQLKQGSFVAKLEAGRTLAKSGKRAKVDLVRQAFGAAHWGIQEIWAEALGEAKNEPALELLLELGANHTETMSLAATFRALGQYRDDDIATILLARLDGELTPRAREAACEALGKQALGADEAGRARIVDTLVREATKRTFASFGEAGAIRALGLTRAPQALAPLLGILRDRSIPARDRQHAATGLGSLARHLERGPRTELVEALRAALRDPARKVREMAASALVVAEDRAGLPELEAHRATLPTQERARLDRQLARLRKGKGGVAAAEKRIGDLEAKLRKLEERLAQVESAS